MLMKHLPKPQGDAQRLGLMYKVFGGKGGVRCFETSFHFRILTHEFS